MQNEQRNEFGEPMRNTQNNPQEKFVDGNCQKELQLFQNEFDNSTVFYSSYSPDVIEKAFIQKLKAENTKLSVDKTKYKLKFTKVGLDEQSSVEDSVDMCVRINKADEQIVSVEFQRLAGLHITFLKYFMQFKQEFAQLNDAFMEAKTPSFAKSEKSIDF